MTKRTQTAEDVPNPYPKKDRRSRSPRRHVGVNRSNAYVGMTVGRTTGAMAGVTGVVTEVGHNTVKVRLSDSTEASWSMLRLVVVEDGFAIKPKTTPKEPKKSIGSVLTRDDADWNF